MPVSTPKEQLNRLEALANLWQLAKKDPAFMAQLERSKLAGIYRHLVIHIPEVVSEPEVVIPALSAWTDTTILNTPALRAEALQQLPKYLLEYVNGEHRDQLVAAVTAFISVAGDTAGFGHALKTVGEFAAKTSDKEVLDSLTSAFKAHGMVWPGWKPAPRVSTINWKEIESLPNSLVVNFTREVVEIELLPYYAPLTTARMVNLARIQYFANQAFHRVVPNFVIQSGDPTGSGWGGPGFMMRTEISPIAYDDAGMLGMASSGLNTEGSQWFITECPTPHLSTRYTIWGRVRKGMEKVFKVTLGEKLETIQPFDRK
jgi:cyclophilin family peptidyl-prolyl cis-trans isomerase